MTRLLLQPASNNISKRNLEKTLWNKIAIEEYSEYIPKDTENEIKKWAPDGIISLWGITPSKNGQNEKVWDKLKRGDIALFGANGKAIASAVVIAKSVLPDLAYRLWGEKLLDETSVTWQYIYFVVEVSALDCDKAKINRLIGYDDSYGWMGVNLVEEIRCSNAIEFLELLSPDFPQEVTEKDFNYVVSKLSSENGGTDLQRSVMIRKEQAFLRQYLFGDGIPKACGICGLEYSSEFLVTAHIKKRSMCVDSERLDYKNIVMPICKFGCDELYERGYLVVSEDGVINAGRRLSDLRGLEYTSAQVGKICKYFSVGNKNYFKAHRTLHLL